MNGVEGEHDNHLTTSIDHVNPSTCQIFYSVCSCMYRIMLCVFATIAMTSSPYLWDEGYLVETAKQTKNSTHTPLPERDSDQKSAIILWSWKWTRPKKSQNRETRNASRQKQSKPNQLSNALLKVSFSLILVVITVLFPIMKFICIQ